MDEKTGYYYFLTDHDLFYICGFQNITPHIPHMVGIYDIEISDFVFFTQSTKERKGYDERVSTTVVDLLQSYFKQESRVLVHLCDASDGRPQVRQALFSRRHRKMVDIIDHEPVRIPIGNAIIYGGILTRKDFP